jgi:arrestin-related trafficking adapter 3/6
MFKVFSSSHKRACATPTSGVSRSLDDPVRPLKCSTLLPVTPTLRSNLRWATPWRFSVFPEIILMTPTISPRKNSLSVSLTESVVFLRSVDFSAVRSTTRENTPPSILRGLLILTLVKPTRISSIQVDLIGQSVTTWSDGTLSHLSPLYRYRFTFLVVPSARYPDIQEKINLFSATRTFFEAPRIPTGRRALSLEPGLSHYADDADFINRSPSLSMFRDPGHTHQFNSADVPRGRERARPRLSEEESILHPAPPLESHLHSMSGLGSSSPSTSEDDDSVTPLNSTVDRLRAHSAHISSRSTFEQRRSSTISPSPTTDSPYESRSLSRTFPAQMLSSFLLLT